MTDLRVGLDASVTTGPIEGSRRVYEELAEVPGAPVPHYTRKRMAHNSSHGVVHQFNPPLGNSRGAVITARRN
jgi:hypothetical protein